MVKKCGKCQTVKELIYFYKNKSRPDGVQSLCKPCHDTHTKPAFKLYLQTDTGKQKNRQNSKNQRKKNPKYSSDYRKRKKKQDVSFRLSCNLRSRLCKAIKNGYKKGSAVKDLGCSIKEFKLYIESKFYIHPILKTPMTWDNWSHSGWQLDHIQPLSSFDLTNSEQFQQANHYSNIRPLWAEEHHVKSAKERKLLRL